jgi:hypothetical protein
LHSLWSLVTLRTRGALWSSCACITFRSLLALWPGRPLRSSWSLWTLRRCCGLRIPGIG